MATDDPDFRKGNSVTTEPGQHLPTDPAPPTGGDMLKSVYDPDDDGKVISAVSADSATSANTATTAGSVTGVSGSGVWHYYGTDASGNEGVHALPILDSGAVFTGLLDTPASYSGQSAKAVVVNGTEDGLEFTAVSTATDFTDLLDTPANFSGAGGYTVRVNSGATALEFVEDTAEASVADSQLLIWQGI